MRSSEPTPPADPASAQRSRLVRWIAHAWSLRYRFVSYAIVGASGVPVNLAVFTVGGWEFGARWILWESALAFAVALVWNFSWNYLWTFRDSRRRPAYLHFGLYAVLQIVALAINLVVLDAWTLRFGVHAALVGQFLGVLAGSVWGFAANIRWNFTLRAAEAPAPAR